MPEFPFDDLQQAFILFPDLLVCYSSLGICEDYPAAALTAHLRVLFALLSLPRKHAWALSVEVSRREMLRLRVKFQYPRSQHWWPWVQGEAELTSGWAAASVMCGVHPDRYSWPLGPSSLRSPPWGSLSLFYTRVNGTLCSVVLCFSYTFSFLFLRALKFGKGFMGSF